MEIDFLEEGDVKLKSVNSAKKPKAEVNEEKARKKLDEWEKKLSRAKTFVKKYKKKLIIMTRKKKR